MIPQKPEDSKSLSGSRNSDSSPDSSESDYDKEDGQDSLEEWSDVYEVCRGSVDEDKKEGEYENEGKVSGASGNNDFEGVQEGSGLEDSEMDENVSDSREELEEPETHAPCDSHGSAHHAHVVRLGGDSEKMMVDASVDELPQNDSVSSSSWSLRIM